MISTRALINSLVWSLALNPNVAHTMTMLSPQDHKAITTDLLFEYCISDSDLQLTKYILNCGAVISAYNALGKTPLQCAASNAAVNTVQCLLELGAPVNQTDHDNETCALISAIESECLEKISKHYYIHKPFGPTISMLLRFGADANQQCGYDKKTPLMQVASAANMIPSERKRIKRAQELLKSGALKYLTDRYGQTAHTYAKNSEFCQLAELLDDHIIDTSPTPTSSQINLKIEVKK